MLAEAWFRWARYIPALAGTIDTHNRPLHHSVCSACVACMHGRMALQGGTGLMVFSKTAWRYDTIKACIYMHGTFVFFPGTTDIK